MRPIFHHLHLYPYHTTTIHHTHQKKKKIENLVKKKKKKDMKPEQWGVWKIT